MGWPLEPDGVRKVKAAAILEVELTMRLPYSTDVVATGTCWDDTDVCQ